METRAPQGFVPVVAAVEPKVKRGSAATDLPKPKSVDPSEKTSQTRAFERAEEEVQPINDEAREADLQPRSELAVRTHEATGSLVVQTLAMESGNLLHQFPNDATLKQRAIARYQAVQGAGEIKRTV